MPYSPTIIANNILSRSFRDELYMTPMKLQKILYFVSSEYQKRVNRPLLAEPFQTWTFGPVVRSVYDEFRPFSKRDITRFAKDAKGNALIIDESGDADLREILDEVWEVTKNRGAVYLSRITHMEGSAWDRAFQRRDDYIDSDWIAQDETYRQPLGLE